MMDIDFPAEAETNKKRISQPMIHEAPASTRHKK
jgi:hypothetical protein